MTVEGGVSKPCKTFVKCRGRYAIPGDRLRRYQSPSRIRSQRYTSGLFSVSDSKGRLVKSKRIRTFVEKLVAAGTVAKEKGWYGVVQKIESLHQ